MLVETVTVNMSQNWRRGNWLSMFACGPGCHALARASDCSNWDHAQEGCAEDQGRHVACALMSLSRLLWA